MKLEKIAKHLRELIDIDPGRAINEARKLKEDVNSDWIKAAIFIDAGHYIKDKETIIEGVSIVRNLLSSCPDNVDLKYNLANGLHALALIEKFSTPYWHFSTRPFRRETRSLLADVASNKKSSNHLASQAYTNLGNLLLLSYRWVEAYDAYIEALKKDRRNGVASSGAVKILDRCISLRIGDSRAMTKVAQKYAKLAAESNEQIREMAGNKAQQTIEKQIAKYLTSEKHPQKKLKLSPYQNFIKSNRLHLSLTIEGLDLSLKRWDSLMINSITESIDAGPEVPPIFAMLNIMKSDYVAARWLAFTSLNANDLPESGYYSDTLDYACYGMKYSLITLAQRTAYDILDKIAVATSDYLGLENAKKIYFKSMWRKYYKEMKENLHSADKIKAEIEEGNVALIALSEVADDLGQGRYLYRKSNIRHSSTHRFTVLHDEAIGRNNECIGHFEITDFEKEVVETLQLVRASLIYFVEMIALREARISKKSSPIQPLIVPSHHYIRGED